MNFDRDTWRTPQYIFNWLNSIFSFDIDLAASEYNHLCDKYFTKGNSALDRDWHKEGNIGFCNPPYSDITPWVDKAILEANKDFITAMLIPCFNGEKRFEKIFIEASHIINIIGRLGFIHPVTNKPVNGNTKGSCVVIFGGCHNTYNDLGFVDRDYIRSIFNEDR